MLFRSHLPRVMQELNLPITPFVLVTTQDPNNLAYELTRLLGVDFIMTKNPNDDSTETILDFLRIMKIAILSKSQNDMEYHASKDTITKPELEYQRRHRQIVIELNQIGICPKLPGYQYLVDAIDLVIYKPIPNLLPILSERYSQSEDIVADAMQRVITRTFRVVDTERNRLDFTATITSSDGIPTTDEFIAYCADQVRQQF